MYSELRDDHREPRQLDMPLISIPTETANTFVVRPGEQPPSLTTVSVPGTTGFVLGVDTCGFTTSSTITCEFGYECTNVGDYRGCCSPGANDCVSTIYTDCIDYTDSPSNLDECGSHTLCCSEANPYCFTYAFTTDSDPSITFRHVECDPSPGFGEMFPFPPELMTLSSETSPTSTNSSSSSLATQPQDDSSSHGSTSAGAIAGAVVGGIVFLILMVTAAVLVLRRHRRRTTRRDASGPPVPPKTATTSSNASPAREKEPARGVAASTVMIKKPTPRKVLRPLSVVHEHPAAAASSPTRDKHKSTMPSARQSFGPNWPLGSNSNPLGAHPVDANLRKRLSDSRLSASTQSLSPSTEKRQVQQQKTSPHVPFTRPLPPPPGTKPATVTPRSPRTSGNTNTTPTSATAMLQSPRLSYIPVSPIETVAFGGKRRDGFNANNPDPVSPIESDEGVEQRLSYVSVPSAPGEPELDDLVSPISADEVRRGVSEDGSANSLATVSPIESRRGSTGFT